MKILIVFPPFANPTYIPYSLLDLRGYVKKRTGISVDFFDWNIALFRKHIQEKAADLTNLDNYYRQTVDVINKWFLLQKELHSQVLAYLQNENEIINPEIFEFIRETTIDSYDCVAFSLNFHQRDEYSQFYMTVAAAKAVKSLFPEKKVLLGGALLNHIEPRELLNTFPFLDIIFLKESEESFSEFVSGHPLERIPNIFYRKQTVVRNPEKNNVLRDLVYLPDLSQLNMSRYFNPKPVITIQFKRGCPWQKCTFCSQNLSYFQYEKKKSAQIFINKLECLNKQGVRFFYFSDQMISPADAKEICQLIEKQGLNIRWAIMALPQKGFNKELLTKMKRAGCVWITWGIESASRRILKTMNKPLKIEVARQNIIETYQTGMKNVLLMIYGFPGETEDDLQQSLVFLQEQEPYYYDNSMSPFHLCKGSEIFNHPDNFKISIKEPLAIYEDKNGGINSNIYFYTDNSGISIDYEKILPEPRRTFPFAEHMLIYSGQSDYCPKIIPNKSLRAKRGNLHV
ncbi:MAG: radical SAM protein [Candidatus Margulisbacteria bacterium]|nr:radical SAM protein [Candidatus Margulisiibacteriota bacterium]